MVVVIPTVDAPHHAFFIGELLGGRRLLSGDISLLQSIALVTARRLDTLRVAHERIEASVREQQISRLATERNCARCAPSSIRTSCSTR